MLYKYVYGNHLATATFLWKIPSDAFVDQTEVSYIFSKLTNSQAFYSIRAMCHDFWRSIFTWQKFLKWCCTMFIVLYLKISLVHHVMLKVTLMSGWQGSLFKCTHTTHTHTHTNTHMTCMHWSDMVRLLVSYS